MNVMLLISLFVACGVMMVLESLGLPTTLRLTFKGDIKRESRWLAQYGQSVCTPIAGLLIWQLDPRPWKTNPAGAVVLAVIVTSIVCMLLKRLFGRVRPGGERAGKFLGPSWKHANYRESFPSSHSASAVALTVMLSASYPQARATFWALAVVCAVLRYLLDAHWPSDVLGGSAIGYGIACGVAKVLHVGY